jgi:hypothetical protein
MSPEQYKEKYRISILLFLDSTMQLVECSMSLKVALSRVRSSANYKAPEAMVDIWRETQRMLNLHQAHPSILKKWSTLCEELYENYQVIM